jgi:uncharacterized damage-inducible protein DinB
VKTVQKLYEHLNWANQSILEYLRHSEGEQQQAMRLFAHILLAEQVWLARLQGKDSSQLPIWSDVDLAGCSQLVLQNDESYTTFIDGLTIADLDNEILYFNSKGQAFQTSIRDVLTHVALHGQYHRGQINSLLRATGFDPVNVDYITFVRNL